MERAARSASTSATAARTSPRWSTATRWSGACRDDAGRGRRPLLQVHVLEPGPGDDRPGHQGPRPRPRGGGRLQPAHARADLPARPRRPAASTRTSWRWPTSASSAAGCTRTPRAATDKATALTRAAVRRVALPRAAGEALRRHEPHDPGPRRRHRRPDRGPGAGRRGPAGHPRGDATTTWAATSPAST